MRVKQHVDFGTCHVIAPCVPIKRYTSCVLCSVPIKRCRVHCVLCEVCAHQSQQQGDNSPCLSTAPLFVRKSYCKDGRAIMYMHFNLQKPFDNDSLIIFLNKPILPFPCCPRPCMITPSHYNGGATPLTAPLELLNATNYHLFGQPSPTTPIQVPLTI